MAATTPPLALPSSLVSDEPGQPDARRRTPSPARARSGRCWRRARAASRAARSGRALPMTRFTLRSSSIRWSCVGRRPAVSASTTSMPRAFAAPTASNITAAGVAARLRDHRDVVALAPDRELLARGRAERVAGGEQHRQALLLAATCASLPIDVVLPAPLTPASMITNGRAAPIDQRLLERREEVDQRACEQRRADRRRRPRASSAPCRSSSRCCVASTPTSRGDERASSSSSSASSSSLRRREHARQRAGELVARHARARPSSRSVHERLSSCAGFRLKTSNIVALAPGEIELRSAAVGLGVRRRIVPYRVRRAGS